MTKKDSSQTEVLKPTSVESPSETLPAKITIARSLVNSDEAVEAWNAYQDLAKKMRLAGITENDEIYADSAEPKSIEEVHREGFNIKPCEKGADSVRAGIDYLQALKIHIVDGSENISTEARGYVRKTDKDGNYLPVPIDYNDHAMAAVRYGIYTHCKKKSFGFGVF